MNAPLPRRVGAGIGSCELAGVGGWGQSLLVLSNILKDRRFHRLALIAAVVGAGLAILAWKMGFPQRSPSYGGQVGLEALKMMWLDFETFMVGRPWVLFVAIVILPGLPLPISPVVVLTGVLYHEHPILACLGCLLALMMNQAWTYWLAAKPGRRLAHWMLERWRVRVPAVDPRNHMKWLLIVRLTPGSPLFLQNYLLGFIHIPYLRYAWVSLLCSGSIACGMVLTGAGIGDGRIGWVLSGLGVLVVVGVGVRIVGARLKRAS